MKTVWILLACLPACGGAPFTVGYASLASGDDAQTTSPDAGEDSAPADPDAAWGGGVDAKDGGGGDEHSTHLDSDADAAFGSDGWIRSSDAGDAMAIGPGDAHADADEASLADSPASTMHDAKPDAPAMCCLGQTQIFTLGPCPSQYVVEPYSGTGAVGASCQSSNCNGTVQVCP